MKNKIRIITIIIFVILLCIPAIASAGLYPNHWSRSINISTYDYDHYLGNYTDLEGGDYTLYPAKRAYSGIVSASTGELIVIGGNRFNPDLQTWQSIHDVWISYDDGYTWTIQNESIPYSLLYPTYNTQYHHQELYPYVITIMTKNDTILVTRNGYDWSSSTQQSVTFRSTDLGATWTAHENGMQIASQSRAKTFVTSDNQIWIIGGEIPGEWETPSPKRYVSYDDGITFIEMADSVNYLGDGFDHTTTNGVVVSDDSFIISAAQGFTRRSYDYGYTWDTYYIKEHKDKQVHDNSPYLFRFNMTGGALNVLPGDIIVLSHPLATPWSPGLYGNSLEYWNSELYVYFSDDYGESWYYRNSPGIQYGVPRRFQAALRSDGSLFYGGGHTRLYEDPYLNFDVQTMGMNYMHYTNLPDLYTVEWDRYHYYTSDQAILSTKIIQFDPDYIYNGVVYNDQGVRYHTYSISSLEQQEYIPLEYWEPGIYFGSIEAIHRITLERAYVESAIMEVVDAVGFRGIVYDVINMTPLDGATVTITQQGFVQSDITSGDGAYMLTNYTRDATVTFNADLSGYIHSSWSFIPRQAHLYEADLYMIPDGYILSGTAIHGIVHDSYTYQAVDGATVTLLVNGTEYNTTSNVIGYYYFEDLPDAMDYTLTATKDKHQSVSLISGTLILNETIIQHIPMDRFYTITIQYLDERTRQSVGAGITVNLDGIGSQQTNSGGYVTFTDVPVGIYWIDLLESEIYSSLRRLVAIEFDTNRAFYVLKKTESPIIGREYPPNAVQFEIRNRMGAALDNATITIEGIGTSLSTWDHLKLIFGWPVDEAPIENTTYTMTTDTQGMATFMMIPVVQYLITIEYGGEILREFKVTPKDNYYLVIVGTSTFESPFNDLDAISSSVTTDDSTGRIIVNYLDLSMATSQVNLNLYKRNQTNKEQRDLVESISVTTGASNFSHNFTLTEYQRQSYFVDIDAQHDVLDTITRKYGVTFGGVRVPLGDIPEGLYIWISLGLLFLVGSIFGATSATAGAVIVCFVSWILWGMGWLDSLGINAPIAMGLASTVSILAVITKRFREEGHN